MKIEKICENCGKIFEVKKGHCHPARFCCSKCWYKWRKKNPKPKKVYTKEELKIRIKMKFESKIIRKDGCWDWNGYCDPCGYPRFSIGNEKIRGHQASYLIYKGDITKGKYICHKCNNPKCCNPDHIYLGTPSDNYRDMIESGRANINVNGLLKSKEKIKYAKGSKNGTAILDEIKVKQIKKLLLIGIPMTKIAKKFGVGTSTINRIKKGTHWKHVK